MNKYCLSILLIMHPLADFAQVAVGTNQVHGSAKFQIESNNRGFLQPRIGLSGTDDVSTIANPATGLMVYNTATAGSGGTAITPGVHYFDGTKWVRMETSVINAGTGTSISGNGTSASPYVINSTSSSGSSPAVYVSGEFLNPSVPPRPRPVTWNPNTNEYTFQAIRCAVITLPNGKWQVNLNNYCIIDPLDFNIVPEGALIYMMYWLQDNDVTYNVTTEGMIPSARPADGTGPADFIKYPPIGGSDSLFGNSVTFIERVDFANLYHKGSFFVNNTTGANKTYYLFASEIVYLGPRVFNTNTMFMPFITRDFANKWFSYNRFYATKIE